MPYPLPPRPHTASSACAGHLPSGLTAAGSFIPNAAHGRREGAILCSSRAPSHPYSFPPNGNGQNAADRIANAMWEIGR